MVAANRLAAWSRALSQSVRVRARPLPRRSSGYRARASRSPVRCRVEPLLHSLPKLAGCAGSPWTPRIFSSSCSISTPQPTPQWARPTNDLSGTFGSAVQGQQHPAVLYLGLVPVGTTLIRGHGFAGLQFDLPVVQRAGHALAVDDALRQRAALVRAAVVEGEDFICGSPEKRDIAFRTADNS